MSTTPFQVRSSARCRLQVFRFCCVSDLRNCLAVCRSWHADADAEPTWAAVYESTQRLIPGRLCVEQLASDDAQVRPVRNLIDRPFGEDAVGWRLAVTLDGHLALDSDTPGYACGKITAYDAASDAYRVAYDGVDGQPGEEVWEVEQTRDVAMVRRNPAVAGVSRFQFISPPVDKPPSSSSPSAEGERPLQRNLMRFSSWKDELRHNVEHVPSRRLCCLSDHTDEVLYAAFSPCGNRLATCSRDCHTLVYHVQPSVSDTFELKDRLQHNTAAVRAVWWPNEPHDTLIVTTEDAGYQGFHSLSTIEIWQLLWSGSHNRSTTEHGHAQRIFRCQNQPFDIHTALVPWPPWVPDASASMSFISGRTVTYDTDHAVQWLDVWPGPSNITQSLPKKPQACLRVLCGLNYLHALQSGPGQMGKRLVALTGTTPHLCDQLAILRLDHLEPSNGTDPQRAAEGAGERDDVVFDLPLCVHHLDKRHILSAKWSRQGDYVIVNVRPYAVVKEGATSPSNLTHPTRLDEFFERPVPDLATTIELLVLDANTLEMRAKFDGHYAFTTKHCPFMIYADEWADTDFLASGGEDGNICIWHRRHRRLLHRMTGHTTSVNAVAWNERGLLASASDDQTVAIWSVAGWMPR